MHHPKLVHAAAPLGQHFTPGQPSVSEREIAVLVITGTWRSAYPTAALRRENPTEPLRKS